LFDCVCIPLPLLGSAIVNMFPQQQIKEQP
jgi:hypothetical protein